ncbi:MAG: ABC transporter permease [Spirochaetaceae bacterium]
MKLPARPTSRVLAVALGLLVALLLVGVGSDRPLFAIRVFLLSPVTNRFYFGSMVATASILLLGGLGIAVSFRGGSFNLGGEGQVYLPGLLTVVVLLWMPPGLGWIGTLTALGIAFVAGAAMAGISGLLRWSLNVPEIISSYLLSAASIPLVDYLIVSVMRDTGSNLLTTRAIPESFRFGPLLPPSSLSGGLFVSLLIFAAALFWYRRSTGAYRLRLVGDAPEFARYGGLRVGAYRTLAIAISGGLYGLSGGLLVTGLRGSAIVGFGTGFGWNGIAVALIAALSPVAVPIGALVLAFLDTAARAVSVSSRVPSQVVTVIQAVILLAVTVRGFRSRRNTE